MAVRTICGLFPTVSLREALRLETTYTENLNARKYIQRINSVDTRTKNTTFRQQRIRRWFAWVSRHTVTSCEAVQTRTLAIIGSISNGVISSGVALTSRWQITQSAARQRLVKNTIGRAPYLCQRVRIHHWLTLKGLAVLNWITWSLQQLSLPNFEEQTHEKSEECFTILKLQTSGLKLDFWTFSLKFTTKIAHALLKQICHLFEWSIIGGIHYLPRAPSLFSSNPVTSSCSSVGQMASVSWFAASFVSGVC